MSPSDERPSTVPGPPVGPGGDPAALAERFLVLADQDLAGYCPLYDRVARALAEDPEALRLLLGVVPVGRTPVLAFAATHDLALDGTAPDLAACYRGDPGAPGDPWPAFRTLLTTHTDAVRHRMATRSVQTNEVGRSAALVPALAEIVARGDAPLALVEVGPSAGLNLLLDRFHIAYVGDQGQTLAETGPIDATVRLRAEVGTGSVPPLPDAPLPIARREGLDPSPVDVTDPAARRWLAACVWPQVPERPERLAAALDLARTDPPTLHTGDAVTDLAALLERVPDGEVPVVIATWALAYLSPDGRQQVRRTIDELGARRDVVLLTAEAPKVTPWIPAVDDAALAAVRPPGADADGTPTVLGLRRWHDGRVTSEALAVLHPHGRWLAWLAPGPDASPTDGGRR